VAVFVHGCFWHRHIGCKSTRLPNTRVEFWSTKFARNVERDREAIVELNRLGWLSYVIWECQTRDIDKALAGLVHFLDEQLPCDRRVHASDTATVSGFLG
jgi:DNA mismatch endonuclease (patch repair protein)